MNPAHVKFVYRRLDFEEHSSYGMALPFDALAKIVTKMMARKDADIFREPVPWEEYGLTDYLQIVKVPMDLGTVQEKLRRKMYGTPNDCGNNTHNSSDEFVISICSKNEA